MKLPSVPNIAMPSLYQFLVSLSKAVSTEIAKRTPDDTARGSLYLRSPDGSTWQITVDDTGVIQTEKVQG